MNEEKRKKGACFFKSSGPVEKILIIIGGLIGIALIFLSSYFPTGSGGSGSAEETLDKNFGSGIYKPAGRKSDSDYIPYRRRGRS